MFNALRPVRRMIIQSITGLKLVEETQIDARVIRYLKYQQRQIVVINSISCISFYDLLVQ